MEISPLSVFGGRLPPDYVLFRFRSCKMHERFCTCTGAGSYFQYVSNGVLVALHNDPETLFWAKAHYAVKVKTNEES